MHVLRMIGMSINTAFVDQAMLLIHCTVNSVRNMKTASGNLGVWTRAIIMKAQITGLVILLKTHGMRIFIEAVSQVHSSWLGCRAGIQTPKRTGSIRWFTPLPHLTY